MYKIILYVGIAEYLRMVECDFPRNIDFIPFYTPKILFCSWHADQKHSFRWCLISQPERAI